MPRDDRSRIGNAGTGPDLGPEALAASKGYGDRRHVGLVSQVKRDIDLAEREGIAITAKRQALNKAIKLHKDGELEESLVKLAACFKSVQTSFSKLLEERSSSLLETAEQVAGEGDITPVSVPIERARECLAHGRVEETLYLLGEAQKALSPCGQLGAGELATQLPRSYWLGRRARASLGSPPPARRRRRRPRPVRAREALEWLRRSEKALREGRRRSFSIAIEECVPVDVGQRLNMDLTPILSKLEDARQSTVMGQGGQALEMVHQASADLDAQLLRFREVEKELERTREIFLDARALKIYSSKAGELVSAAREAALEGRLVDTMAGLTQARAVLLRTVHEQFGRQLLDNELKLAAGLSMGAPVEDDEEELENIEEDLRDGYLKGIEGRISSLNQALEEALMTVSRMAVVEAEQATSLNFVGANLAEARERVRRAQELMEGKEWYLAFSLAQEVVEDVNAMKKAALRTLREQTRTLLEIARQLGVDPQTIDLWGSAMATDDPDPTESLRSIGEIFNHARVSVKEELGRAYAQLMRSASIARRKGVTTEHVEQLAEEGRKALASFELEVSFNKYQAAERELDQTSAMHNEVYDLIVLLSRLTAEIQVPAGSKIQPLLMETKRLFEAGLYDGARTSARNCYHEAETLAAHILAPKKVLEVNQLLLVLRQVDAGTDKVEEGVRKATDLLRRGESAPAMALLKEIHKEITERLTDSIRAEIDQLRSTLDQNDLGRDEMTTLAVVEKTERLLDDQRFSDALQAIRFARSETMQVLNVMTMSQKELSRVEGVLTELSSVGIQVKEARAILEQAVKHRSSGRFNLVAEMARRAEQSAWTVADGHIRSRIEALEKEIDLASLSGPDLESLKSDVRAKVGRMAERHYYADTEKVLARYRGQLQDLVELRERCSSSLSSLSRAAVPATSPLAVEAAKMEAQARKAYDEGAYHLCSSLLVPYLASAKAAERWHGQCSRRLKEVEDRLRGKRVGGLEGLQVAELLDTAGRQLAEGRYEDMERSLLQAERIFNWECRRQFRKDLAELRELSRLLPSLGIALGDLPAEAERFMDGDRTWSWAGDDGSGRVEAVRSQVRKALGDKAARIKGKVEQKGDGGAVRNLLSKAERALAENRLEQALGLMIEAELMAGRPWPMCWR